MQQTTTLSTFDARLVPSFGMIVSGPPLSGKSTFVLDLLNNTDRLLTRQFDYVVYFYGEYSKTVETIEKLYSDRITTVKGLPENLDEYIRYDDKGEGGAMWLCTGATFTMIL